MKYNTRNWKGMASDGLEKGLNVQSITIVYFLV
jgi:hypothetical protein